MNLEMLLAQAKQLVEEGQIDIGELKDLINVMDQLEEYDRTAGLEKWVVPGSEFGLDKLPKHAAVIKATKDFREILVLGANRAGKTNLGCYMTAVLTTGKYPDWWDGVYYDEPIDAWAIGMSAQTTRDTLQKALLGEAGNFGTGMIPRSCIGKVKMSAVGGAVDYVKIKHTSGRWSEIGFKAYKQDTASFFGVKRHWAHMDEPAPELVYAEVLVRTAFEKGRQQGRVLHTITPKEGLTRLLADLLSTSEFLAGSQDIPNLKLAKAIMDAEVAKHERD